MEVLSAQFLIARIFFNRALDLIGHQSLQYMK